MALIIVFRFVLANSEYPDEVRHYEVFHLGHKDICGLFLCESFPRQETGKVVWVPSQFGPLTQLSEMSHRSTDIFLTK